MELKGLNELNSKLSELAKIAPDTAARELTDIAFDLAGKCSDAAPVELGDLQGDIANPRKEGDMDWKVGSDLPYCAMQHEHTEINHPRGGGAKFLEKPVNENADNYINAIGEGIMRELR